MCAIAQTTRGVTHGLTMYLLVEEHSTILDLLEEFPFFSRVFYHVRFECTCGGCARRLNYTCA